MPLLQVEDLNAFYDDFQALFGIGLHLGEGECIAVIGANGAGKSTLLRSLVGLHRERSIKRLNFADMEIGTLAASKIAAMGMTLVPEGRRLFSSLTVEENLTIGRSAGRIGYWNLSRIYELFPALPELARRQVARLSGGQQQMVASSVRRDFAWPRARHRQGNLRQLQAGTRSGYGAGRSRAGYQPSSLGGRSHLLPPERRRCAGRPVRRLHAGSHRQCIFRHGRSMICAVSPTL